MSIALAQATTVDSGSSNPSTISLSGVTAGNSLILYAIYGGSGTPSVSSVTGGGTWAKVTGIDSTNLGADVELWWCKNATGGSTTATVTFSATPYGTSVGLWMSEWSGLKAVNVTGTPKDSGGSSPAASPTITPFTGDLVLMAMGFVNTPTVSPSSPWTVVAGAGWYTGPAGNIPLAYQIAPNTSALTANWTASGAYAALGVSFTAASGAALPWQTQPLIPIFPTAPIGL